MSELIAVSTREGPRRVLSVPLRSRVQAREEPMGTSNGLVKHRPRAADMQAPADRHTWIDVVRVVFAQLCALMLNHHLLNWVHEQRQAFARPGTSAA